jgi:hypothetical protein
MGSLSLPPQCITCAVSLTWLGVHVLLDRPGDALVKRVANSVTCGEHPATRNSVLNLASNHGFGSYVDPSPMAQSTKVR